MINSDIKQQYKQEGWLPQTDVTFLGRSGAWLTL